VNPGIYAVAALEGQPVREQDCATLGIAFPDEPASFAVSMRDNRPTSAPLQRGAATFVMQGIIDNPDLVARELGAPASLSDVELAACAYERWPDTLPARMQGEWSLVRWDGNRRQLTAIVGDRTWDPVFIATDGTWVAVAPSPLALARLSWVGMELNAEAVATVLLPWRLRARPIEPCYLKGIHLVEHGTIHRVFARQQRTTCRQKPDEPAWSGDFAAAVEAMETTTRSVIRRQLASQGDTAILLSGGLDSSLIAALAVQEARAGQRIFAVSSVARPEDAIPDERRFIEVVARHLGIDVSYVTPPDDAEIYRPPPSQLAFEAKLVPGPRHYLYRALYEAAADRGATAVMSGDFGEASVTRDQPLVSSMNMLRSMKRPFQQQATADLPSVFSARPSREIATLFDRVGQAHKPAAGLGLKWPGAPMGPAEGEAKSGRSSTAVAQGSIRRLMPLRATGLVGLSATLPAGFTHRKGQSRAIAREILSRHLPELIARRPDKGPFSPDYKARLYRHAREAHDRLPSYRASGVGTWLDLQWLSRELAALERGDARRYGQLLQVQATALTAEMLVMLNGTSCQGGPA
jgi:asparagine synthase (glutamine-hydrolysing)